MASGHLAGDLDCLDCKVLHSLAQLTLNLAVGYTSNIFILTARCASYNTEQQAAGTH